MTAQQSTLEQEANGGAFPTQTPNDDENMFANRIGNFHKGLRHNNFGEVIPASYDTMLKALKPPRDTDDFEKIDLSPGADRLTSPQAGLAGEHLGPDPRALVLPPAYSVDSAEEAAEAGELYWMALLRDVPFTRFDSDERIAAAAEDLSNFSKSDVIHPSGTVTSDNIFRGTHQGDGKGPYLSQFLLKDVAYGSLTIEQRQKTVLARKNYLTTYADWLNAQNGQVKSLIGSDAFDRKPRYVRNMRDLGQYVHVDTLYEAYLNACLILLGLKAPMDEGNPYNGYEKQKEFATFGGPHVLSLVTEVASRALKVVWFQKWMVHRRLRPEAFGGLVHLKLEGLNGTKKNYPLHPDILNSGAVQATHEKYGTYLMPMAFPEGSPTHPAYGAGHATVAGACATILKAWFEENTKIVDLTDPEVTNVAGTELVPYTDPDAEQLTVGGELNKIASNIAIGRNAAGVHWRSDYTESVKLGETVAICILKKESSDYHEKPNYFKLRRFDGKVVKIQNGKVTSNGMELYKNC